MINIAPLDNALAYIDAHPDEWDQSTWICETTACVAGRIVIQAGRISEYADIPALALEILGMDGFNHPLFWSSNTRDALTVWRMVLAGERVILPSADLNNSDFSGADLKYSDLRGANLREACLDEADLTGADLSEAILADSDLSWANLENTDFTGADLLGADLIGTILA